jgi:membrane protease subunit HflC
MNRALGLVVAVVVVVAAVVGLSSVYTVTMTEQALILQFGKPVAVASEPGLHFKLPFVQDVEYLPKLLLNLDAPPEEVIAQDKKRMVVDAFARYRVVDPLRFYQALKDQRTATLRLTPILSSNVRRVLGSQTFAAVLSAKRAILMQDITKNVNQDAANFGIKVVDMRIRRADLPPQNSAAIFKRMQKEREREASEFRAEGQETKQRIMARADREVTVLTAEATRESEILRGQGDAEKTRILGNAYDQDKEFFAFYRSMQAYTDAFQGSDTSLVLSPKSEFFQYFGHGGTPK